MTRHTLLFLSLVVLAGPAQAQSAPEPGASVPSAPFEAGSVREFLSSCGHDMSQCDFEIRTALLDKLHEPDATSVCLKGAHYQAPVIAWLEDHTESWSMPTEDGIYTAVKNLYPCP